MTDEKTIKSLYLHFPFCRHLCNYCDFYKKIGASLRQKQDFHDYLDRSWDKHAQMMESLGHQWGELESLYIGGGTPSLWGSEGAMFLSNFLAKRGISLSPQAEVTMEVNPGSWTSEGLQDWRDFGVNRFSLGVQALDIRFLKLLDRVHNLNEVHHTLEAFAQMGEDYSVDFMLGLPFSKVYGRDIETELKRILEYAPSHLSLYILTTPPSYIHAFHLPTEEWIEREFLFVSQFLQDKGLDHYEVSNFARPGKESFHNYQYWRSRPVAALGPSATGFFPASGFRYKWRAAQGANSEVSFTEEYLTPQQLRLEKFYLGLRTRQGVVAEDFFTGSELTKFQTLVSSWSQRDLVSCDDKSGRICATSRGYLLLDGLMDELFSSVKSL